MTPPGTKLGILLAGGSTLAALLATLAWHWKWIYDSVFFQCDSVFWLGFQWQGGDKPPWVNQKENQSQCDP